MNLQDIHKLRLMNDYRLLCSITDNDFFTWEPIKGIVPYVEEYLFTIKVRTYAAPNTKINQCKVRILLPPTYPQVAPVAIMEDPKIYHPNWLESGRYDCGCYKMTEILAVFVWRMIQNIQFNPTYVNPHSPFNHSAAQWYLANQQLFPSDNKTYTLQTVLEGKSSNDSL